MKRLLENSSTLFQYGESKQPRKELANCQVENYSSLQSFHLNDSIFIDENEEEILNTLATSSIRKEIPIEKSKTEATLILRKYKDACRNLNIELEILKEQLQESYAQKIQLKRQLRLQNNQIQIIEKKTEDLYVVNRKLQYDVINKVNAIDEVVPNQSIPFIEDGNISEPSVGQYNADRTKMHMGRDIWIETEKYTEMCTGVTSKFLAKFVKRISLFIFGKETLLNSTVSGQGSNRSKQFKQPQKALDPVKLLAIRDFYSFMLRDKHAFTRNDADLEAANTFRHIMKYIADLKSPKRRNAIKKSKPKKKKVLRKKVQLPGRAENNELEVSKDGMEEEVLEDELEEEVSKDEMEASIDQMDEGISNNMELFNNQMEEEIDLDQVKEEIDNDIKEEVDYEIKEEIEYDIKEEIEYEIIEDMLIMPE